MRIVLDLSEFECYKDLDKIKEPIKKFKKLNVFDFDNTLFSSPEPNPLLWDKHSINLIKNETLGWYQDINSFDLEHLKPFSKWFNLRLKDPKNLLILLTGRGRNNFINVINEILESSNLRFHFVALKEKSRTYEPSTFEFKKHVIEEILKRFNDIDTLEIWEDRIGQIQRFEQFARNLKQLKQYKVNEIVLNSIHYPFTLELEIVNQLLQKSANKNNTNFEIHTPHLFVKIEDKSIINIFNLNKYHEYNKTFQVYCIESKTSKIDTITAYRTLKRFHEKNDRVVFKFNRYTINFWNKISFYGKFITDNNNFVLSTEHSNDYLFNMDSKNIKWISANKNHENILYARVHDDFKHRILENNTYKTSKY